MIMKNNYKSLISAGVLALTGLSASANSITLGVITSAPDGSGGTLWTYPIVFANTAIDSTQPSFFNLNDFGPLKTTGPLPSGWSFTGPGVSFTVTTPLVGPNAGLPGFQPNNPAIADFVVTFTSSANLGSGTSVFNLVLDTAATGTGGLANFFSADRVATGNDAGSPNGVQQNITTPMGTRTSVPDGGVTAMLLGAGLSGLGLLRRKLS